MIVWETDGLGACKQSTSVIRGGSYFVNGTYFVAEFGESILYHRQLIPTRDELLWWGRKAPSCRHHQFRHTFWPFAASCYGQHLSVCLNPGHLLEIAAFAWSKK